jgi:hypothetical protein
MTRDRMSALILAKRRHLTVSNLLAMDRETEFLSAVSMAKWLPEKGGALIDMEHIVPAEDGPRPLTRRQTAAREERS